jgi:hypothetical protein
MLAEYGDEAEARADAMNASGAGYITQPTQTHVNLVNMLDEILSLATMTQGGHPMLRASLRTVRHLKPVALEELAQVPEAEVKEFMRRLMAMMARAIGGEEVSGDGATLLDGARPAESPPERAGTTGGGDSSR